MILLQELLYEVFKRVEKSSKETGPGWGEGGTRNEDRSVLGKRKDAQDIVTLGAWLRLCLIAAQS